MSGTMRDRLARGMGERVGSMRIYGRPMGGSQPGETSEASHGTNTGMPKHLRLAL